jgi:hypothetical protein
MVLVNRKTGWEKAAESALPPEDWFYRWLADPDEVFLPPLIAIDWIQYLAAIPILGRREASYQCRCHLFLTDRRLVIASIIGPRGESLSIPLRNVIDVDVMPPPGRKVWGWNWVRRLYRVEVMRILYRAEGGIAYVYYDAAADTEPFAAKLREYSRRIQGGSIRQPEHP